jgi:hypothetical protein|tara:strand:- start:202 stop:390 length:189 start_codon:yes stop_codon:yes gene_type:complete
MKLTAYDKLRVILGVLIIAFMLVITIRYGLKTPPIIKIAFLALDAIVIYYAINRMILRKKEK